uniref:Small hydrophobic protein n=1 Tax=Bovine orthopneumovirus TaxID=11246 RepID=Q9DH07_9MONO|nr:small hydrophobic protein [Bovine orthopneumovirus]AAG32966.1 small hydrophobic protein [Bovine orthopneumovirus]AAG32967.1 small hydrophobic protein [Bovine orthopneumovirus]WDY79231.1 small hydrophobic protein [Bovine orthopneumovirus]
MNNTSTTIEFTGKFWTYFTLFFMMLIIGFFFIVTSLVAAILNKLCDLNNHHTNSLDIRTRLRNDTQSITRAHEGSINQSSN